MAAIAIKKFGAVGRDVADKGDSTPSLRQQVLGDCNATVSIVAAYRDTRLPFNHSAPAHEVRSLVDQLLQLARFESGSVKKERIYLHKILKEAELKFEKQIQQKGMLVSTSIAESISIYADSFFFSVIIDNLVSNAIKYGVVNGKISFSWTNDTRTLSIVNDGTGITQEQIPLLFNRFYRTDDSRSSMVPGSGLGLAIVKKLADLQHITIAVSSTSANTTFSLKIPE